MGKVLSTIGLVFDILGAWLVAWEVVRQFSGIRIETVWAKLGDETPEYRDYEKSKFKMMWWGLGLLTIGFILQIAGIWC
jgi:hypothetical protein